MGKKPTAGKSAKKTPDKYPQFKDGRKNKGSGTYPNAWRRKTRSGHLFEMDDSKDAEHITIQHRSGSMVQFLPDGAVQNLSHNGQHNMVFGENRTYVTGANDVTVDGDSSIKTKGDSNQTTEGGSYVSVNGPSVEAAKSKSSFYEEHNDVMSKSAAVTTSEDFSVKAGKTMSISAAQSVTMGSDQGGFAMHGATAGLKGREGVSVESVGQINQVSRTNAIDAPGGLFLNCGLAQPIKSVVKLG